MVFYSMYGHVEGLARRLKKGVDSVEGVEMVLYRVPEMLSAEILQQTRVSSKDDGIPVVTAEDLAVADVVLFGFLMRYRSMVGRGADEDFL
ncbi:hypothetical protein HN51_046107 [Arachis hypogaea]